MWLTVRLFLPPRSVKFVTDGCQFEKGTFSDD